MNSIAPPTSPGPVGPLSAPRVSAGARSAILHALVMASTCFVVPLAMGSNIWPIAGVFWSGLCVPVAGVFGWGFGALFGWLLRGRSMMVQMTAACFTAASLAAIACAIIVNNR